MSAPTLYEVRAAAAWITLNRPERRNALGEALVASLRADLARAVEDGAVRAIVLTGAGAAFCAGAELRDPPAPPPASDALSPFPLLLLDILQAPKPVIAAVNGAAYAGGLGLVAAADIAIAAPEVRFAFSEVRIGVIPAIISVPCLRKMSRNVATRLFITGESFGAEEARDAGLIGVVASVGGLIGAVEAELALLRKGAPQAVAAAKALVQTEEAAALRADLLRMQELSTRFFASAEAAEGMAAFHERRAPAWERE